MVLAGGVSANKELRTKMLLLEQTEGVKVYTSRLEHCTDNGAMIAYAGYQKIAVSSQNNLKIKVNPRWAVVG